MKKLLVLGLMLALVALLCPGCGGGGSNNGGTGSDISSNPITAGGGNTISGRVTNDGKGGLNGIQVSLRQPPPNGGAEIATTTTSGDGNFSIAGITNGWANVRLYGSGSDDYTIYFNNIIRVNGNVNSTYTFFTRSEITAMTGKYDAGKATIMLPVGDGSGNPRAGITVTISPINCSFGLLSTNNTFTEVSPPPSTDGSTKGVVFLNCNPGDAYSIYYGGLSANFDPLSPLQGINGLAADQVYIMPYVTCY